MTRNSENKTVSETREDIESDAPGMLWVVATPIGTIEDFSPRACRVLGEANLILAEDTRRTRKLLTHFEIPTRGRLHSLHLHNEKRSTARATKIITGGGSVALVSDAGTPVLSDPGHMLVCAAHEMGAQVLSVPGPSSFTAALAASPQRPLPATLVGFLPAKAGERTRRLKELGKTPWTIVVLLSPHRLATEVT
ncbi:MAG: 16S rRNA (cytidine(1402)-2'-O)-methyltransferase, partial [bacterium]|nr:16S rRNA (cytidine(1402)-2'-O)-methyltransferase [bacterium]